MKIILISDTHGYHDLLTEQLSKIEADMIIYGGDWSGAGYVSETIRFCKWFEDLPFKYKVAIAGNHERSLDPLSWGCIGYGDRDRSEVCRDIIETSNFTYLENSGVEIEGIKLWGSPITPTFYSWAFMADPGDEIKAYWDMIPTDTDILITHGPPYGFGDMTAGGQLVGCRRLLERVRVVQPKLHVFGHIHEGYGNWWVGDDIDLQNTQLINASVLDEHYDLVNDPIVFDYTI